MIIGCGYSSFASESNDDFQDASLAVAAAVPIVTMNESYKFSRKLIPIYTTIGIVRCTLGLATDDLAVKPYIPQKILLQ